MSEIWYKLCPRWASKRIVPVEIMSSTGKTVTIAGRRHTRITSYECYFPTKEAAKAYAIEDAQIEVNRTKIQHAYAVSALDIARKLEI